MSDEVAKETKLPRRTALKQTTLSETVYQEIRTRLQRGEIEPNDRVLDYEVAEEFDCTRMPVRQALLRLVNEGYLVGTTRGFVVPTLTSSDIREIFEMRRLLEPSAAAGAAANLTEKQEAALNRAYRKACKAYDKNDTVTLIDANIEFRDVWLADHVQQVRLSTLKNRSTHKIVIDGMQVLLDGFTKRDPKKIKAAMLEFIANAEEQYFALLGGED